MDFILNHIEKVIGTIIIDLDEFKLFAHVHYRRQIV